MVWIIASHLFFYAPGSINNLQMILTYAESWYLQPLFSTAMCVDTYFVIRLVGILFYLKKWGLAVKSTKFSIRIRRWRINFLIFWKIHLTRTSETHF